MILSKFSISIPRLENKKSQLVGILITNFSNSTTKNLAKEVLVGISYSKMDYPEKMNKRLMLSKWRLGFQTTLSCLVVLLEV